MCIAYNLNFLCVRMRVTFTGVPSLGHAVNVTVSLLNKQLLEECFFELLPKAQFLLRGGDGFIEIGKKIGNQFLLFESGNFNLKCKQHCACNQWLTAAESHFTNIFFHESII